MAGELGPEEKTTKTNWHFLRFETGRSEEGCWVFKKILKEVSNVLVLSRRASRGSSPFPLHRKSSLKLLSHLAFTESVNPAVSLPASYTAQTEVEEAEEGGLHVCFQASDRLNMEEEEEEETHSSAQRWVHFYLSTPPPDEE